jgi:hypothetical protein
MPLRCARRALSALLLLFMLAGTSAWANEPVFPAGFRFGLTPPPGLALSRAFPGFEDPDNKVVIAFVEYPLAAYYELEKAMFSDSGPRDIVLEKRELFPFASGMGFLLTGRQESDGTTYRKWLLVAQGAQFTAVVNVQVPEASRDTYPDEVVRSALRTLTFRAQPIDEQLAMMPFRLGDLAGFRVVKALPMGAVVLTDGPKDDVPIDQPHLIVSVGPGSPPEANDRQRFAQQLLSVMPGFTDVRVTGSEPMRIRGQPGFEVRADARDAATNTAVTVVQWVRFGTTGFLRIVGLATKDAWPQAFPRFRAIRDGIDVR